MLLEKLRYAVYRQLLKRVYTVHAGMSPERSRSQVPLRAVQRALQLQVRRTRVPPPAGAAARVDAAARTATGRGG